VRLFSGVRTKKFSSILGCEDSAFALSDNLYLLLKRATRARLMPTSTATAAPGLEPHDEADTRQEQMRKSDRVRE